MEFSGERLIAAAPERVFEALNDEAVLREAIPGCEELEAAGEHAFTAKVVLKIGPVKAKFTGEVTLDNLNPPHSFSLAGKGKGGAAGYASGKAYVNLEPDEDSTRLSYTVKADLGGKIAQLGGRLIQGTANKLSAEFFDHFAALIEEADEPATASSEPAAVNDDAVNTGAGGGEMPRMAAMTSSAEVAASPGTPAWVWWSVGGLAALVAVAFSMA